MKKTVTGFKAFNTDILESLEKNNEGKIIIQKDTKEKYKNGIYLAKNIEDSLKYVDRTKEISIAKVKGFDNVEERYNSFYEFYGIYTADNVEIQKILSRKQIINEVLKGKNNDFRIQRFISLYKLTDEEIDTLRKECQGIVKNLDKYIEYYQYGQEDAFTRKRK